MNLRPGLRVEFVNSDKTTRLYKILRIEGKTLVLAKPFHNKPKNFAPRECTRKSCNKKNQSHKHRIARVQRIHKSEVLRVLWRKKLIPLKEFERR